MESLVGKDACTRVGKQSGKRIESIRGTTPRLTQPAAVVVLNVNYEAPDPSSWIAPKPDWATTFKLATKTHPHIQLRVICDNYATHKPPAAGHQAVALAATRGEVTSRHTGSGA
ncbi:hypothetical protein ABFA25_01985 [Mycobacterium lepromatosis]|uniref:hypothetical protein n=1 Tax=Mycobacterium lepromatosis TaxID=480418 RepID=UPI003D804F94